MLGMIVEVNTAISTASFDGRLVALYSCKALESSSEAEGAVASFSIGLEHAMVGPSVHWMPVIAVLRLVFW